jgi:hypothetical protein
MSNATAPRTTSIRLIRSEDPADPRVDCDSFGKMVCFHGRYRLGDKHQYRTPDEFHNSEEFKNAIVKLPLYLYDHSGITMRTYPFDCPWDSGMVGFIIATMDQYRLMTGRKAINESLKERLKQTLLNEVKVYDQFLQGEVYDLEVDGEIVCCGFYGTDWETNGVMDYVPEEMSNPDLWEIE